MRLVRVLRFRNCPIKIMSNDGGFGFDFEYKVRVKGEWISSRTSYRTLDTALSEAKMDISLENA